MYYYAKDSTRKQYLLLSIVDTAHTRLCLHYRPGALVPVSIPFLFNIRINQKHFSECTCITASWPDTCCEWSQYYEPQGQGQPPFP